MLVDEPGKAKVVRKNLVENYGYEEDSIDTWIYSILGNAILADDEDRQADLRGAIRKYKSSELAKVIKADYIELYQLDPDEAKEISKKLSSKYKIKSSTMRTWEKELNKK